MWTNAQPNTDVSEHTIQERGVVDTASYRNYKVIRSTYNRSTTEVFLY